MVYSINWPINSVQQLSIVSQFYINQLSIFMSIHVLMSFRYLGDRLLDIPCKVCGDRSSGKHYGIYSCDGKTKWKRKYILISIVYIYYKWFDTLYKISFQCLMISYHWYKSLSLNLIVFPLNETRLKTVQRKLMYLCRLFVLWKLRML